jgi:hypothetical protein
MDDDLGPVPVDDPVALDSGGGVLCGLADDVTGRARGEDLDDQVRRGGEALLLTVIVEHHDVWDEFVGPQFPASAFDDFDPFGEDLLDEIGDASAGGASLAAYRVDVIPEIDLERVRRWAAVRVPVNVQDQLRLEVDVDRLSITVLECQAPWADWMTDWTRKPVARLRHTKARNEWTLYCYRSSGNFERYEFAEPARNIEELLDIIDEDPTSIFWG